MIETKIIAKDSTYQKFEVLKSNRNKRYKYNEFLVEGVRSLKEAVTNKWNIKSFIYDKNNLSDWARNTINSVNTKEKFVLTPELMKDLSGKEDTSELMAIIEMREDKLENVTLSKVPFILLFDRPSNKGNLGTIIRSCDSLGAGSTAHKEKSIEEIDFTRPLILMIGNETMGLNKAFKEYCDVLCTIPMDEKSYATSFNVGCAASIMMYEVTRQRRMWKNPEIE